VGELFEDRKENKQLIHHLVVDFDDSYNKQVCITRTNNHAQYDTVIYMKKLMKLQTNLLLNLPPKYSLLSNNGCKEFSPENFWIRNNINKVGTTLIKQQ